MTRHAHHHHHAKSGRPLPVHLRRKLSEEGKRLLRHALAHEDEEFGRAMADGASVDYSVVTNRDDASNESDLEDFGDWQSSPPLVQQQQPTAGGGGGRKKHRGHRLRDQYDDEEHDELEEAMEQLTEKRDTTKIQALNKILTILCSTVLTDRMHTTKRTLTGHVLTTLKKRMSESGALSLRVLGVLAITLGPDEHEYYEEILQPLQRLVTDQAEAALRIEATYALSIACFVCARDEQQRWELLDILGGLLVAAREADENGDVEDEFPEELLIAVMESWVFLLSSFQPTVIVPKLSDEDAIVFDHLEALASLIRDGMNHAIRSAACEVLAFLIQYKYIAGSKQSWSYDMEDEDSPLAGLDSKIERYMRETAKSIGKKTRKTQRSMLKEVLETLRTGEGPHKDLQIEGETLSVSTWSRFFQAHVFRRALQSGFQVHLHENEVLRDVFDVSENTGAKVSMVSTVRRRADHRSKAISKRNDISRKDAAQNAFLYEE